MSTAKGFVAPDNRINQRKIPPQASHSSYVFERFVFVHVYLSHINLASYSAIST